MARRSQNQNFILACFISFFIIDLQEKYSSLIVNKFLVFSVYYMLSFFKFYSFWVAIGI